MKSAPRRRRGRGWATPHPISDGAAGDQEGSAIGTTRGSITLPDDLRREGGGHPPGPGFVAPVLRGGALAACQTGVY